MEKQADQHLVHVHWCGAADSGEIFRGKETIEVVPESDWLLLDQCSNGNMSIDFNSFVKNIKAKLVEELISRRLVNIKEEEITVEVLSISPKIQSTS